MILKADDFKYPSQEERNVAGKDFRSIETFPFPYESKLGFIMQNMAVDYEGIDLAGTRKENLWRWSHCLQNRLGKLKETYIYVITSYNRGFDDNLQTCSQDKVINKLMFDYYTEIFYYFFSSAQDIIAQVLNIYFKFKMTEKEVSFQNVLKKTKDASFNKETTICVLLGAFYQTSGRAAEFRNSFAHRFTPTEPDYRVGISIVNDKKRGNFIKSDKIIKNIKSSMKSLVKLMQGLNDKIKANLNKSNLM